MAELWATEELPGPAWDPEPDQPALLTPPVDRWQRISGEPGPAIETVETGEYL